MQFTRNQLIIIGSVVGVVFVIGLIVWFGFRENIGRQDDVRLMAWGVFDDTRAFQTIADGFSAQRRGVIIEYRQFTDPVVYERELVNALAAGTGPDIFMFHNTWLPKHYDKVIPFLSEQMNIAALRELFPKVVEQDFSDDGFVYALPLSVDTLAMLYNKDDFNSASIVFPPKTWSELEDSVSRLRRVNTVTNEIIKPAAAIGGSLKSINRAADLLSLLMLQSGTRMTDSNFGNAAFSQPVIFQNQSFLSGLTAFNFYTQFANASSPFYTWNDSQHYSLDGFADESVSIIFNYAFQIPQLKQKNPFLSIGIASMPQPNTADRRVDFPNYWGLAVSNISSNSNIALDFVKIAATDANIMRSYGALTQKPPALLSLINEKLNDQILGVFARQALTARSWPQIDNVSVEEIFSSMIEAVISGRVSPADALKEAENSVTALMRQRRL
ncbi:MAG: ABC transporter, solute-binding protein [Parcubacteria group bacterium GW2011_GWB1_45_9]|nr:MAG: ABC transporter, solute-binding protein [Parcubacteria group bacterium GW2011_GWB1_45_9]